jgi:hypothetical protein
MTEQKTYDVTNLTPLQRQQLIRECMEKSGFKAYIKKQNNKQTHYTFQYSNS